MHVIEAYIHEPPGQMLSGLMRSLYSLVILQLFLNAVYSLFRQRCKVSVATAFLSKVKELTLRLKIESTKTSENIRKVKLYGIILKMCHGSPLKRGLRVFFPKNDSSLLI